MLIKSLIVPILSFSPLLPEKIDDLLVDSHSSSHDTQRDASELEAEMSYRQGFHLLMTADEVL